MLDEKSKTNIKLKDICYISKGKKITNGNFKEDTVDTLLTIANNYVKGDKIYYIGYPDIENNKINYLEEQKIEENVYSIYQLYNFYKVDIDDIVFPIIIRKSLNIKYISEKEDEKIIYNDRTAYLRVDKRVYNPKFLFVLLNSKKYIKKLFDECYDGNINKVIYQISLKKLMDFSIPKLTLEEQNTILKEYQKLNNSIKNLKNKQKELIEVL